MAKWTKAQRDRYWDEEFERAQIIAEQYDNAPMPAGLTIAESVSDVFN